MILKEVYRISKKGASIYFMQREKNTQYYKYKRENGLYLADIWDDILRIFCK